MITKIMASISELLSRLVIGLVFIQSGWGKLHQLEKVISYFDSLGIPYSHLQAPVIAAVELIAGVSILIGFKTRLASIPLLGIMLVAIVTAKWEDVTDLSSLFAVSEFLYVVIMLWLLAQGSRNLSIDALMCGFREGGACKKS